MCSLFIYRFVVDSGFAERFYAFGAGAAFAAVVLASFVATPSLAVVDAESFASACDVGFGERGLGREETHAVVGAGLHSVVHRLHEGWAAVGVDSMVAGVVRHHNLLQAVVFG